MKSACLHIEEAVNRTCMLAVDCLVTKYDAIVFVGVAVVVAVSLVVDGVVFVVVDAVVIVAVGAVVVGAVVVLCVVVIVVVVVVCVVFGAGVVDAFDGCLVVVVFVLNVDKGIEVDPGKSGSTLQLRVRMALRLSTII